MMLRELLNVLYLEVPPLSLYKKIGDGEYETLYRGGRLEVPKEYLDSTITAIHFSGAYMEIRIEDTTENMGVTLKGA